MKLAGHDAAGDGHSSFRLEKSVRLVSMLDVLNAYRLGQEGLFKDRVMTLRPTISNEIGRRVAGHSPGLVTPEGIGKPSFSLLVRHGTMCQMKPMST